MLMFKMNEPAYVVRKVSYANFNVSKFEESNEPSAVYLVREGRKGHICYGNHCRRSSSCKHVKIVVAWKKASANKTINELDLVFHEDGSLFKGERQ
jgi:hypothetical protein